MAKKTEKITKISKKTTDKKTVDQLKVDLVAKKNDLIEAKRGHKLGELTNPHAITSLRKDIARLHTAIRAAELASLKEDA